MGYFNTGTVTLDRNLEIVKGDKNFFAFIGWENTHFIEQCVYKEDFPEFKTVCKTVWSTGEKKMIAYRACCLDGAVPWVIANISKAVLAGMDVLELNFQSVDTLEQEIVAMKDDLSEIGTYMDILDEFFFRYDVEQDDFCLFMGGEKQRIALYSGDLDGWEQSLEEKKAFSNEKNHEIFLALCQDLQQASRHFSHEIMLPHLVRGEGRELYLFKGRSIINASGRDLVLGCVYTMTKNTRRRKSRNGADAVRDEMTGLLSKQTIIDYIKNAMTGETEYLNYLCVMDIDDFKYVNDNYGHLFGDEVLITVADILKEAVGDRGVVGRIGGDEMLIFLEHITDRADLKSILRTIRCNVEWAYKGIKEDFNLSCSIGAAAWPKDALDYDTLFKIADKMLYRAKNNGKNRYIIYTPEIHGEITSETFSDSSAVELKKPISAVSKERFLMELTENFIFHSVWSVQLVLEETGSIFGLKEIDVFYEEPFYNAMHWRADGKPVDQCFLSYAGTSDFRQLFDENDLAVIHGTNILKFTCPEAYETLKEMQVTSAIIYQMDSGIPGYVTFYKEEQVSRLWSDADITYLNLIGKMIAMVLGAKRAE